MQIPIGEQVVILDSGITGILDHYNGSTAYIDVNGEIHQAHKKDIARVSDFGGGGKIDRSPKDEQQKAREEGLFIQWKAVRTMNGDLNMFDIELLNHTRAKLIIEYSWYLLEELQTTVRNTVASGATIRLHGMKPDAINDRPVSVIQCWRTDEKGVTIPVADMEIRLRPKQYFTRITTEPFLSTGILSFPITLSDVSLQYVPPKTEESKTIFTFSEKKKVPVINEVLQKAAMPDHIDLHAEKLLPGHHHLSSADILQMQLSQFRHFLEKAIRLRLHRVYIVHGHGKGVLKQEIEKALRKYPEVQSFNNDYTPRFGHGATEIILD